MALITKPSTRKRQYLEIDSEASALRNLFDKCNLEELDQCMGTPPVKGIKPKPGCCIKAKTEDGSKIFINICHSPDMPKPPESLDMSKIFEKHEGDETLYRFPLSLGEPHEENDKSGKECMCYDVIVNSEYYEKVEKSEAIRDFITTLSCTGLERKYNIEIDVGTCTLLKKPYHGTMPLHYIKWQPLMEAETIKVSDRETLSDNEELLTPKVRKMLPKLAIPEIPYKLFITPATSSPSKLILQAIIPDVVNFKAIRVLASEDSVAVQLDQSKFIIDIILPHCIQYKRCLANFVNNRLLVVMPTF